MLWSEESVAINVEAVKMVHGACEGKQTIIFIFIYLFIYLFIFSYYSFIYFFLFIHLFIYLFIYLFTFFFFWPKLPKSHYFYTPDRPHESWDLLLLSYASN